MHLLYTGHDGDFRLAEFFGKQIPLYAILSHTWIANHEEVTFKDITKGRGKEKAGYGKLNFIAKQAAEDKLEYFWVDTCCIDKASSAELQEAINSMFSWYQRASKCYVYLADVSSSASDDLAVDSTILSASLWEEAFLRSRWFTRGWTLQELLAPETVEFYSSEGNFLGDKATLWPHIEKATKIPVDVLQGTYAYLLKCDVDDRLSWAAERKTTREEDAAYSLLGLFDLHIPLLYGEGRDKAFVRLHRERESGMLFEKLRDLTAPRAEPSSGDMRSQKDVGRGLQREAPLKRTLSEAFEVTPVGETQGNDAMRSSPMAADDETVDLQEPINDIVSDLRSNRGSSHDGQARPIEDAESTIAFSPVHEAIGGKEMDMKALWDDAVLKDMDVSSYYTHVSVLLIKWVDELDELRTREELQELDTIFRDRFQFTTEIVELDVASKPQHQLSRHVSSFIAENDGPDNLLIVYYTGHGIFMEEQKELLIAASFNPTAGRGVVQYARANWNKVEETLLEDVDADVLTLLDTAYASNLEKGRPVVPQPTSRSEDVTKLRRFQTLAACGIDQVTAAPGQFSFTRALIGSLDQHLKTHGDQELPTSLLNQQICLSPQRYDTPSLLWTRLGINDILLKPMKLDTDDKLQDPDPPVGGRLTLEFELRDAKLRPDQIKYLSSILTNALVGKKDIGLRGINWVSMVPAPWPRFAFAGMVMFAIVQWKRLVRHRREQRKSSRIVEVNSISNGGPSVEMPDAPPS